MRLNKIARIQSGYISRGKIEPSEKGSYYLLQARDMDADRLTYRTDTLLRIDPALSRKDWILETGDILFMARGIRNYSILLNELPDSVLAAACFFIIRAEGKDVLPGYLCWYLNQPAAENYFHRHAGQGVHMPVIRRSVLENIDIPIPPLKIQKKIIELNSLMIKEKELLDTLSEKRRELITATCLKAIKDSR